MDASKLLESQPWPEILDTFIHYDGHTVDALATENAVLSGPHDEVKGSGNGNGTTTLQTNTTDSIDLPVLSFWTRNRLPSEIQSSSSRSTPFHESHAASNPQSLAGDSSFHDKIALPPSMLLRYRVCKRGSGFHTKEGLE